MSNTSATAQITFNGDPASLEAALNRVEQKMGSTESAVNRVGGSLTSLVAALVSVQSVLKLMDSARHGEQLLQIKAGFEAITGGADNARLALERGREATQNTVADYTLMSAIMKGLKQELDLSVVLQALAFAENQASVGAGEFEQIYDRVTNALFRAQRGGEEAARTLAEFGVSGRTLNEILASMSQVMADVTSQTTEVDQVMDRWDANIQNIRDHGSEMVREFLGPTVQHFANLLLLSQGKNPLADLAKIMDDFSDTARPSRLLDGMFNTKSLSSDAMSVKSVLQDLFNQVQSGTATVDDYAAARDKLLNIAEASTELTYRESYALGKTIEQISELAGARQKAADFDIKTRKTPLPVDPEEVAKAAKAADDALRQQLQNERDYVKLKIGLGTQTYDDLNALLDQQEQDYKEFYARDTTAYHAWLADKVAVRQNDRAQQQKDQTEVFNDYRRLNDSILADESKSRQDRLREVIDNLNFQLAYETMTADQRDQLIARRRELEREFTRFVEQQYQQQLDFLMGTFGTTALQIVDDFFRGTEKRFEEYLKNLLALIARYAVQMALLSIFRGVPLLGLFGGGGSAAGGIVGGGVRGGGGILGGPPSLSPPDFTGFLNSLPRINGQIPFGAQGPAISNILQPTPVQVQLLIDKYGLAAVVREGNQIYNRSTLTE